MTGEPSPRARALGLGGLLAHALVGVFPYAVSGLIAPPAGVVVLGLLWLALGVLAWALWRRRPAWVPVVPLVALAMWFAVVSFGGAVLGWTA